MLALAVAFHSVVVSAGCLKKSVALPLSVVAPLVVAFVQGGFSIFASATVARLLPASKALAFTPVGF